MWNKPQETVKGTPLGEHAEIDPTTGLQKDYRILPAEEREKGYVRPVRLQYTHEACGVVTQMALAIAETYARTPGFYGATYCVACRTHFPVGKDGEFVWEDGSKVGT